MHMADALISPAVGAAFMAASGAGIAYCAKKLKEENDDGKIPMMGVLGAFVFAAQMINFTIPATGSSGHLGGGMLLAIVLGPYAAFIVMAGALIVQALFFADGGLLALGANIWNLAFYPCVVGWMIYRVMVGREATRRSMAPAAFAASIVAVELGAVSVVAQTALSGKVDLPLKSFTGLMVFIHFFIAIVEGAITAAVAGLMLKIRPRIVKGALGISDDGADSGKSMRPVMIGILIVAAITAGGLAWFASEHPDGLEWSLEKIGWTDASQPGSASKIQDKTAVFPDYSTTEGKGGPTAPGLFGVAVVMAFVLVFGWALTRLRRSLAKHRPPEIGD